MAGLFAWSVTGRAELAFTLTPAVRLADQTNALVFTGTLSNGSPTELVFLNDVQFTFLDASTNLAADTNAFFANVPGILLPGEVYTDTVFSVSLSAAAAGDYFGTVTIQGGTNVFLTNTVAEINFEVATYTGLSVSAASFKRLPGIGLKIRIADLLTHVTNVSTDAVAFVAADANSTNGVNLPSDDAFVYYTNAAAFHGCDSFDYSVTDVVGRAATGTVLISVQASGTFGPAEAPLVDTNQATMVLTGIPDGEYVVQCSTNLVDWAPIATNTVLGSGVISIEDIASETGGVAPAAFYRLVAP